MRGLLVVLVAFVGGALLPACRADIRGEEARRLVSSGHLPGAGSVPVQELDRRMDEVGPRTRPVVVYCRSGMRSARAARMLRAAGFTAVRDLGAMRRW
jgi:rhodanese-related sulfurtransferase